MYGGFAGCRIEATRGGAKDRRDKVGYEDSSLINGLELGENGHYD